MPPPTRMQSEIDHELPHEPVAVENWSENYVFSGFDPEAGIGFYHHMARMPYDPQIWRGAFGVMLPGGQVLVHKDHRRTGAGASGRDDTGPDSGALAFVCREPFRRWEVRYDGVARLTTTEALTRGPLPDGPTVPVRLDLTFEPTTPPWGFGDGMESETWADVHYEHPGRFSGRLRYDGTTVPLVGTGYRDHSVGPRDVGPMLSHTWVHGEFAGGRAFQVFAARTRPDQRFTSAYVASPAGGLSAARVEAVPGWQGRDGDPGSFTVVLDTDDGRAVITGRTLAQRYHWSALVPWEFVHGADLGAPDEPGGPWPVLETIVAFDWDGERGYGLLEVTRPRAE